MSNNVEKVPREELDISRRELGQGAAAIATGAIGATMVSSPSAAQTTANYIRGTVEDSGGSVDGATVVAVPHDQTLDPLVTTTDSNGDYAFEQSDLYDGEKLYHVITRDGTESDPKRGQENYPFVAAEGDPAPPDSEDLHARYDATEISASDGDAVSTWNDQTGNGHDLTAGTSPTFKTGVIGGNPVVRFDGVDDFLDVAFSPISQPNHIFAVFRMAEGTSVSDSKFLYDSDTDTGRNTLFVAQTDNDWTINSGTSVSSDVSVDENDHISSSLFNGTGSVLRLDGSQIASGDSGADALNGFTVGDNVNGGFNTSVDVGEILIYPQDKSGVQGDIEQYLSDKWGVSI